LYIHEQSSTRICLPSLCPASYNSLSFPTGTYTSNLLRVFVYHHFVRHPIIHCPSLLSCTYTSNLLHVFVYHRFVRHPIIHCPSLLGCTYTSNLLRVFFHPIIHCPSLPRCTYTVIYTSSAHHRPRHQHQITHTPSTMLPHTHPRNPYCNRKIRTTNEFHRLEYSS
jgi:hypothetical protein